MTDAQPTGQIPDDAGLTPRECPHHFDCDGIRCDPGVSDVPSSAPAHVELEETITDPAAIRATDEPDERGDFPCCATPTPVGAAVALDLDAARAMLNAANTIKATGGAVEIGGVRIEPCDEYGSTVTTARAESAEAEVVTLRARLAEAEALADQWADRKRSDGMSGNAWIGLTLSGVAADLRAALATTGEGL